MCGCEPKARIVCGYHREHPRLCTPRWRLAYNNARARAVEAGVKPGVAMEVKK